MTGKIEKCCQIVSSWQAPEWEQDAREAGIEGLTICPNCDGLFDGAECPCAYRDFYPGEE